MSFVTESTSGKTTGLLERWVVGCALREERVISSSRLKGGRRLEVVTLTHPGPAGARSQGHQTSHVEVHGLRRGNVYVSLKKDGFGAFDALAVDAFGDHQVQSQKSSDLHTGAPTRLVLCPEEGRECKSTTFYTL